jgi:hypothetical protein
MVATINKDNSREVEKACSQQFWKPESFISLVSENEAR